MTYDNWKATNPEDEWLGPEPEWLGPEPAWEIPSRWESTLSEPVVPDFDDEIPF